MNEPNESESEGFPTRRVVLALGAVAASTVVTIRPALAQTAGSVLNCEIPVPAPNAAGNFIATDGSLVPAGTQGAFPPASRPLKGEEVRQLLNNGLTPAGMDSQAAQAYAQ